MVRKKKKKTRAKKKPAKKAKKKSKKKSNPKKTKKKSARKKTTAKKSNADFKERRQNPRLPICARVLWRPRDSSDKEERFFFTRDLSASGLFLITTHPPPLGTVLDIELAVQYIKEPLQFQARVVRFESEGGRAMGCGVEFEKSSPDLKKLLKRINASISN